MIDREKLLEQAEEWLVIAGFQSKQLNDTRERMTQEEESHHRALIAQWASISMAHSLLAIAQTLSELGKKEPLP